MESKSDILGVIAVLGLAIALVAVVIYQGQQKITVNAGGFGQSQTNTVTVTGFSELQVDPDQAIIHVSVVTDASTAKQAQQENAKKMNAVFEQLQSMGIKKADIETESVYLSPKQHWDPNTGKTINDGYTQTNTVKVTINNIESTGEIMDEAVAAGANMVGSIQFDLSKEKRKEVNAKALEVAAKEARAKAESLADTLGVKLGKISMISEANYVVTPVFYDRGEMMMAADAKAAPTPINPQKLTVNLNVNIAYEIA